MNMKLEQMKKCPMCDKLYANTPAISRTKGHEEICPRCGMIQAVSSMQLATTPTYHTREVAAWIKDDPKALEFCYSSLNRHIRLDWGEMDDEDMHANDLALINGDRLLSSYKIPTELNAGLYDDEIWIITEADRSTTTILFPSDY